MDKNEVVSRISMLRTMVGLSARDLSLSIGKNAAYISRLESKNDTFEPSVSALLEIIDACGSSACEFFYYDMNAYQRDKDIIDLLKTASPAKKDAIITLLKNK